MNTAYSSLAPFYDAVNGAAFDYDGYSAFLREIFRNHGIPDGSLILDLACGSGLMTTRLCAMGYDLIGVDLSPDMLMIARENLAEKGYFPLLLCQDMCDLDLYGTVDGGICALDSMNYLTRPGELDKVFGHLKNFVRPGGIFVFDLNSPYKFKSVYADNVYTYDENGVFCVWQNEYNEKTGLCHFDLTFFEKEKGSLYRRREEHQEEKMHDHASILAALDHGGFELLEVVSGFDHTPANDTDLRLYYIVRRKDI